MIESMRRQRPVFTAVERPAQDTDRVTIDFDGKIDGQPFEGGEGRDVPVLIGSRQSLPELEEGLKGATAGEKRTVTLSFPADSPNKAIAGKTAQLRSHHKAGGTAESSGSGRRVLPRVRCGRRWYSRRCVTRFERAWNASWERSSATASVHR